MLRGGVMRKINNSEAENVVGGADNNSKTLNPELKSAINKMFPKIKINCADCGKEIEVVDDSKVPMGMIGSEMARHSYYNKRCKECSIKKPYPGDIYDEKTGTITWTVDLAKGETKTFNVNVTVLGYGVLSNTVVVGNKTAVRNITVPEIITVKEVNSSDIHIGDEIAYTITVSNPGKINATNVVIRDILPEGLKFINASNGGVYDPVTGIITWILNITANSTVDLTADVCVNKSGNITNTVNVGNKTSNCTIESGDIVDLEIHIVADKSEIYVGDNIVYTVTVINNGPSDAINTIANILIPNALSIFSYNATKGTFDITSGNWSIGNLTNGEKVVLTFVAKALNEGNSTVYVNVTSETFEVIMENNYDNVTVKVLKKAAPIGPDKQVHPDGSSSDNECGKSVNLPNTGNPLVMLLLCILSVIFVGSRKRKL